MPVTNKHQAQGSAFSGLVTEQDIKRGHQDNNDNPSVLKDLRSLKVVASHNPNTILNDVVCGLEHTFPLMLFANAVKASDAIHFAALNLSGEDNTSGQVRKLYQYAISQPSKCIAQLDNLPRETALRCLTDPVFGLKRYTNHDTKHPYKGYHNLISVALCADNLDLAKALYEQLPAEQQQRYPSSSYAYCRRQYQDVLRRLAKDGLDKPLEWLFNLASEYYNLEAFHEAGCHNSEGLMEKLYNLADDNLKVEMLNMAKQRTFPYMVFSKFPETVKWFYGLLDDSGKKQALKSQDYNLLCITTTIENKELTNWICRVADKESTQQMLKSNDYKPFKNAVELGNTGILNILWQYAGSEVRADLRDKQILSSRTLRRLERDYPTTPTAIQSSAPVSPPRMSFGN